MKHTKSYYVALDSEAFGPYSLNELLGLGLMPDTPVCTSEDGANWQEAQSYPELYSLFAEPCPSDNMFEPDGGSRINQIIWRQKRKAALIGIFTLGLAGLAVMGVGNAWRANIFAGTSFDQGGVGFVMKILSFILVSVLLAIPFVVISVIRFVYYQIKISSSQY